MAKVGEALRRLGEDLVRIPGQRFLVLEKKLS